ncbi:MFS transporter [Streptomyces sp. SID14478]|uniref:MFS transporter n=1 Tax=Streptomyces sp. SID14478 TaxID=2706073 RepID=UPI0013DF6A06|nr:MFS transporter [Streptomyces sp. SID14478]NEB80093.1 MFS transporter [Streptomyces sp. SID14478]
MTPSAADWRMLAVVLTGAFMGSFDLFVVNVATEALRADLHASDAALELVVSGYAFAYAAGLITGGRLGDRFGYRRTFVAGMAAFTLTSLLCGLAQDSGQLVAARLAQGLAAAVMVPQVLSLATARFPPEHRGRATAWNGAVSGLGAIAGQLLGGLLLQADVLGLGWRAVFLVNVPVGVVAALLAWRMLPPLAGARRPFDVTGAVGVTACLALLLMPLALGRDTGWPPWTWLCLAAVAPVGRLTWRGQRALRARGGEPVLNPTLFHNRPYVALVAALGSFQLYFGAYMFTLALLLQAGLGASPLTAGAAFVPQAVLFTVGSLASGRLKARSGRLGPAAGGALVLTGLALLAAQLTWSDAPSPAALVPALALNGLGNGLLMPALIGAALTRVTPTQAGAASGLLNTANQAASSLGVALLGIMFFTVSGPGLRDAAAGMVAVSGAFAALVAAASGVFLHVTRTAR